MTFTIEFGWWLVPLAITVLGVGGAFSRLAFGDAYDLIAPFTFLLSIIAALAAWLVWAVLR